MNNHFIIPYAGNKREEVEKIYNSIVKHNVLNEIKNIVEPYCGTAAMSFYISTKHPKKYTYILNDNNILLIELYKIISNDDKLKEFIEKINKICFDKDKNFINKIEYNIIVKQENVEGYFIRNKFYTMRAGLYPMDKIPKPLDIKNILNTPIINFLKNENIILSSCDALECIKKYNNNESLILLDPPYLMACNDFYDKSNINIYEWLYHNSKTLYNTAIILEYNWIIQLLFRENEKKDIYEKHYRSIKKKVVEHMIAFYNK